MGAFSFHEHPGGHGGDGQVANCSKVGLKKKVFLKNRISGEGCVFSER